MVGLFLDCGVNRGSVGYPNGCIEEGGPDGFEGRSRTYPCPLTTSSFAFCQRLRLLRVPTGQTVSRA